MSILKSAFLVSTLISSVAFSQVRKSEEEHWMATQLEFEKVIYGNINQKSCNRSLNFYFGCLNALNTALSLVHQGQHFLLIPDASSRNPLPGFRAIVITDKTPNVQAVLDKYRKDITDLYNKSISLGYVAVPVKFEEASVTLAQKVKASGKESYYTGLAFNSYLSYSYDPHTYIIPLTLLEERSQSSETRKAFGFNFTVGKVENQEKLIIFSTIKNSPAAKAGFEPGDLVLEVNGATDPEKMLKELDKDTAEFLLEGSKGTRHLKVTRGTVSDANVKATVLRDSNHRTYGYIKFSTFSDEKVCETIINESFNLLDKNIDGIIFDVRDNGGGLLNQAICLMHLFLEPQSLTWLQKNIADNQFDGNVVRQDFRIFNGLPAAILINGHSASASEALAMYLQAYRKAYVVGERSFGKGTMQQVELSDLNPKVLKASTAAKYYGPHGVSPQLQGVKPDFEVFPTVEQTKPTPYQREEDLYKNAIVNKPKAAPVMQDRLEEIRKINNCMNQQQQHKKAYEALDQYKKRVFDLQLAKAQAVIDCTLDLRIPIFQGTKIPTVPTLD